MTTRPLSVTIVAWFLIVSGALSAIMTPMHLNDPMFRNMMAGSPLPFEVHIAISAIAALVTLVCGVGVLKGKDWARLVYAAWAVVGLLIGLFASLAPSLALLGLVMNGVILFFLFRAPANRFFGRSYFGRGSEDVPPRP